MKLWGQAIDEVCKEAAAQSEGLPRGALCPLRVNVEHL